MTGEEEAGEVRVAVIGAGRMGRLHIKTCLGAPNCRLVAIVDPQHPRHQADVPKTVEWLDRADQLPGQIDAAIIATPPQTHAALATALLASGIHCLVEKPATCSQRELGAMQKAAEQGRAILAIGHSERFNLAIELLLQNYAGRGRIAVKRFAPPVPDRSHDLDIVEDLLVHDIDWTLHGIKRNLLRVDVSDSQFQDGLLAALAVRLKFEGEMLVDLFVSRQAERRERVATLYTSSATLSFDLDKAGQDPDPLTRQLSAFLAAINGIPSAIASPKEAARVMRITELIRQKCRDEHPVLRNGADALSDLLRRASPGP